MVEQKPPLLFEKYFDPTYNLPYFYNTETGET